MYFQYCNHDATVLLCIIDDGFFYPPFNHTFFIFSIRPFEQTERVWVFFQQAELLVTVFKV